jgi:alpha-galactosidase
MLAAPLIAGNDVRSMSESTRNILTNVDVIDVDQDSLAARAAPSVQDPRVLVKPLADGTVAVALFNADQRPATIAADVTAVSLPPTPCYTVRDLWSHTDTAGAGQISRTVAPHDVAMLRISPRCRQLTNPAPPARTG